LVHTVQLDLRDPLGNKALLASVVEALLAHKAHKELEGLLDPRDQLEAPVEVKDQQAPKGFKVKPALRGYKVLQVIVFGLL
jgi:hypothetical protein